MICTIEMPNADAEAILRFLQRVDAAKACDGDPYERSRLESALEVVTEALESGINDA